MKKFQVSSFKLQVTSLLALVCLVFAGCSTSKEQKEYGTKVLMIGNSFSISLLQQLPQVAADCGVELDLASLYIGGCSLKRHWENVERDGEEGFRPYRFGRNRFGAYTQGRANVCEALRMEKWDIVTVQQASHESWKPGTYREYGEKLLAKIRELAPQAMIYVQETWSYTPWDGRLAEWGLSQDEMYERLHGAYAGFAQRYGIAIIPFGTAVQTWRRLKPVKYAENSFGGDVVGGGKQDERDNFKRDVNGKWVPNCDVFHLNRRGEYFQALVWAKTIFGVDVSDLKYKPDFVSDSDAKLMREIAMGRK